MILLSPWIWLSVVAALVVCPCLLFAFITVRRGAACRVIQNADARIVAKLQQLEADKAAWIAQWEDNQVQAGLMADRIRLLERLLIDERRLRLTESKEILELRAAKQTLEERLEKAADAIRRTNALLAKNAPPREKEERAAPEVALTPLASES